MFMSLSRLRRVRKAKRAHHWRSTTPRGHAASRLCPPYDASSWRLRRLDAVQAVRGVLDGEEHHVAVGGRLAAVHRVGRDVDERAGLRLDRLAADVGDERALEDVDPLLVGMRV